MAQIIFGPSDVYELRKKDALIRERAKKLLNYGILERKIINKISYWNVGKSVFSDIPIYVDKKKIKFLGVIIKIDNEYVIHGISK
jgi:lipoate-protein ligase B